MFFYSVGHVIAIVTILISLVSSGLFDAVETECGYDFYAENLSNWEPVSQILPPQVQSVFRKWMKMPANTLVNLGYVLVGFILFRQWSSRNGKNLDQLYYPFVFAWLSIFYGPIQLVRIVTQSHRSAVLDQWITFPFFSWVVVWYLKVYQSHLVKINYVCAFIYLLSVASYCLTLFTKVGFEIALGIHIIATLSAACHFFVNNNNAYTRYNLVCGILSCCGFVVLKLYDKELATLSVFSVLTGHFWSKVCDCLQIYYISMLFLQVQPKKVKAP